MKEISIKEKLNFCTTRIEAKKDETTTSYGTGFFFDLALGDGRTATVIITNKHVVEDAKTLIFYLSKADTEGNPILDKPIKLSLDEKSLNSFKVEHPDMDLCCIAILPLIKQAKAQGFTIFYVPLTNSTIPNAEILDNLDGFEDIVMVGYPNALWDDAHNMPLIRKGITATWPKLDFQGRRVFLIDAACYPGSSGSPVMICDNGSYDRKDGELMMGKRFILLGVQHAVPVRYAQGEIKVTTLEDIKGKLFSETQEMLNLGFIIKSECILDLIPEFIKKFPKK